MKVYKWKVKESNYVWWPNIEDYNIPSVNQGQRGEEEFTRLIKYNGVCKSSNKSIFCEDKKKNSFIPIIQNNC